MGKGKGVGKRSILRYVLAVLSTLLSLAEDQHGLFSASQAIEQGVDRRRLSDLARRRILVRVHRGVYRVRGGVLGPRAPLMAACLAGGPGTLASHRSAADLWGLAGIRSVAPEVISPRWRSLRSMEIVAHESNVLDSRDEAVADGVPVVTPLRTVFLLGAVVHPAVVAQAIDQGTKELMFTVGQIHRELIRLGRSGRDGIGAVREALDLREFADGTSESVLEQRFLQILRNHGFPAPARQYAISTATETLRADFAYPDTNVVIELDGQRWHSDADVFQRDRRRQNALVVAGWEVLRFTWDDVVRTPHAVVATLSARLPRFPPVIVRPRRTTGVGKAVRA